MSELNYVKEGKGHVKKIKQLKKNENETKNDDLHHTNPARASIP